jgi:hypothetical protein
MTSHELTEAARAALDRYSEKLHEAHIAAGKPSYRTMARKARRMDRPPISPSTISRVLAGNWAKWEYIETLLSVWGIHQRVIAESWRPDWVKVTALVHPHDRQTVEEPAAPPAGYECPECGAWVINQDRHEQWHRGAPRLRVVRGRR